MAGLSGNANDGWRLTFRVDNKPEAFRFTGPKGAATLVKSHVESILTARTLGASMPSDCARWLAKVDTDILDKLERCGVIGPEDRPERAERLTLGQVIERFLDQLDCKESTRVRVTQATDNMLAELGATTLADSISVDDAEGFRAALRKRYAQATVSRTVGYARQVYRHAMKKKWVTANPFSEIKRGSMVNAERSHFVDRPTVARLMEHAPSAQWRLLIALSRFGGLRVPSEAVDLRWNDIDFDAGTMTVRSRKTEHHEGKASRTVPIFPELRGPLMDVFDAAEPGTEHVITEYRREQNLNPHLRRIVDRAGLTAWPRIWHSMRASRQTELVREFPLTTACAWMGNSKLIAAGHYTQTTDADWQRAVGGSPAAPVATFSEKVAAPVAAHTVERKRTDSHKRAQPVEDCELVRSGALVGDSIPPIQVGRPGLEQTLQNKVFCDDSALSGCASGNIPDDPELQAVAEAWPTLPPPIRAAIRALIQSSR